MQTNLMTKRTYGNEVVPSFLKGDETVPQVFGISIPTRKKNKRICPGELKSTDNVINTRTVVHRLSSFFLRHEAFLVSYKSWSYFRTTNDKLFRTQSFFLGSFHVQGLSLIKFENYRNVVWTSIVWKCLKFHASSPKLWKVEFLPTGPPCHVRQSNEHFYC